MKRRSVVGLTKVENKEEECHHQGPKELMEILMNIPMSVLPVWTKDNMLIFHDEITSLDAKGLTQKVESFLALCHKRKSVTENYFLPCSSEEEHNCDVRVYQGGCCIELERSAAHLISYPKSAQTFGVWILDIGWEVQVIDSKFSKYRSQILKIMQDFYRNALPMVDVETPSKYRSEGIFKQRFGFYALKQSELKRYIWDMYYQKLITKEVYDKFEKHLDDYTNCSQVVKSIFL